MEWSRLAFRMGGIVAGVVTLFLAATFWEWLLSLWSMVGGLIIFGYVPLLVGSYVWGLADRVS